MREAVHHFAYRRSKDQDAADQGGGTAPRHPVVIVGAGPVGLTLALDLGRRGVAVVLVDESDRIGAGSRAICFANRTLEVLDSFGIAAPMVAEGVTWQIGRVYHRERELYAFDLMTGHGHKMPAFVNVPQHRVEALMVARAASDPSIELRWKSRVVAIAPADDHVTLTIDTPDGPYALMAEWLVICDGARSPCRELLGLGAPGEEFPDRFLIADIKLHVDLEEGPVERHFWFDPPFHAGKSALMHRQPDNIWRIDLQLGRDADASHETQSHVVRPRIAAMLGHENFTLDWVSLYAFQCRRLERFVHGRAIFAGDAAHQVSPFGARGANSGIQDAHNLGWKLAAVLAGKAGPALIESYHIERGLAADENIRHSTNATDFIAPRGPGEAALRAAVLALAPHADFARRMVNSGRLSTATSYDSPLSTPDIDEWNGGVVPGAPFRDAPLERDGLPLWLSDLMQGKAIPDEHGTGGFALIGLRSGNAGRDAGLMRLAAHFAEKQTAIDTMTIVLVCPPGKSSPGELVDIEGLVAGHYDLTPGAAYLMRPDGHVAARFRHPTPALLRAALLRALATDMYHDMRETGREPARPA